MNEIVVNLHMHTFYSDGSGSHADIAAAALRAGLDAVIVTDHNVWVVGPERYYRQGQQRVLLLVGEELHDRMRLPQKSHLLVFGAERELATFGDDPQRLVDAVRQAGGLAFIAHPCDPAAPLVHETDISWEDWQVQGYTGIELWNGFSEFKIHLRSWLQAWWYALNPEWIAQGPFPRVLQKWDELTQAGRPVVAIGGSDAHALPYSLGFLRKIIFPYEFHFRAVNTHLLLSAPLSGEAGEDRQKILEAFSKGHCFIGYDLPASTRGFRFTAQSRDGAAWMGDEVSARSGVTLQIRLPRPAICRLICNGQVLRTWQKREICSHITSEPGVYRVEVYLPYAGAQRGWIFSNPIYVR